VTEQGHPQQPKPEDVMRGTAFSLAAVPAGVLIWVVLWRAGFIASIVALGVAFLAMYLYRSGSGGAIGRSGAVRVTAVTIVTLLLAFFAGVVSDVLEVWTVDTGEGASTALLSSDFWSGFGYVMGLDGVVPSYGKDAGLALLFGALGCFSTLRGAFSGEDPPSTPPGGAPGADGADTPAAAPAPYGGDPFDVGNGGGAAPAGTEPSGTAPTGPTDEQLPVQRPASPFPDSSYLGPSSGR